MDLRHIHLHLLRSAFPPLMMTEPPHVGRERTQTPPLFLEMCFIAFFFFTLKHQESKHKRQKEIVWGNGKIHKKKGKRNGRNRPKKQQ